MTWGPAIDLAVFADSPDTGIAAEPDIAAAVLFERGYRRVTPGLRRRTNLDTGDCLRVFKNAVQAACSSDPDCTVRGFLDGMHCPRAVVLGRIEDFRMVPSPSGKPDKTAVCCHPIVAGLGLREIQDIPARKTLRRSKTDEL